MNRSRSIATVLATAGLMVAPGLALAGGGHGHGPHGTTGPSGATSATGATGHRGEGFGVLCASESRGHVAGLPGTPFSHCVVALAREDASAGTLSPAKACAGLPHRHVHGMRGTPFSRCVVAAAHLRGHPGATGATGTTGGTGTTGATD